MPSLNWIGKEAVVRHHAEVPFRLLEEVPECSCPPADGDTENLIVQGDNLEALKALLPCYAGQVKCIYIDPPYNTGEQKWTYSDRVDSPEIRLWLNKTVGGENEDLSRHDKWLCMMYPRLQLLSQFLADDGFLMVSLNDEGEIARFRVMMEEILPGDRYVTSLVWKSRRNLDNRSKHNISVDHEYVVVYRQMKGAFRGLRTDTSRYTNPDNDPRGTWTSDNLVGLATKDRRPNLHYELVNPETGTIYSCPRMGWRFSKATMAQMIAEKRILWPKTPSGRPRHKKFLSELLKDSAGYSSFVDCGNTNEGTLEVREIFGQDIFMFPKPRSLIEQLIEQTTDKDSLILDSFAGSGTTGHAVLALNRQDGGHRRFILVEMDEKIAREITAERVRRVATGYTNAKDEAVPGLGGGFQFATLGKPLFDETGAIRSDVKFAELAEFVFFKETGRPLPRSEGDAPSSPKPSGSKRGADGAAPSGRRGKPTPLLGVHEGRAVYLLFNGILGDKRVNGGNVLTSPVLAELPAHAGPKVIYAAACRLGRARLEKEQITFKQTPWELHVE